MNREALNDLFDYTEFTWASYERVVRALPEGALMKAVDGSGWPSLFDALKHLVSGHDGWLNETYHVGSVLVEDPDSVTTWEQLIDIRVTLTRFTGHLDCSDMLAQEGVQDGQEISSRVPPAGGGVGTAA